MKDNILTLNELGTAILLIGAIVYFVFTVLYVTSAEDSLRTPVGRAVTLHTLNLACLFTTVYLANVLGLHFWGREWFRLIFFGLAPISLLNLLRLLVSFQFRKGYAERYRKRYNLKP